MTEYGSNFDYVMEMELSEGLHMIAKAYEKRTDNRLYSLWITLYPHFTEENFLNFSQFKEKIHAGKKSETGETKITSDKTDHEAISMAEQILKIKK